MTDAQFAMFEQLAARPFLVLDTEYCRDPAGDGNRLISVAITPVIRGRRGTRKDGELYVEMNPGVPIDAATSAVHGFTDAAVARNRSFAHHAPTLLNALEIPGAILVTHTGADIHVLRRELERLDETAHARGHLAPVGLSDLPELLLDTSTLPRMLRYPGVGNRGIVSLETLCQLTGVSNAGAHHAQHAARATAAALIRLPAHAARDFHHASIEELLAEHDRGTTKAPRVTAYPGSRPGRPGPGIGHLARHTSPLTHAGGADERAAWIALAAECVRLRCPHLRAEAALAAPANGKDLLDPLYRLLPSATEPGQPGTLLGAVAALIEGAAPHTDPPPAQPVLTALTAMRWWGKRKKDVAASPACGDAGRCSACADGARLPPRPAVPAHHRARHPRRPPDPHLG